MGDKEQRDAVAAPAAISVEDHAINGAFGE